MAVAWNMTIPGALRGRSSVGACWNPSAADVSRCMRCSSCTRVRCWKRKDTRCDCDAYPTDCSVPSGTALSRQAASGGGGGRTGRASLIYGLNLFDQESQHIQHWHALAVKRGVDVEEWHTCVKSFRLPGVACWRSASTQRITWSG